MFDLRISIRDPQAGQFQSLPSWSGTTPLKNKVWEIEIYRDAVILEVSVDVTAKQSHAGVNLTLGALGYALHASVFDCRHWNHLAQRWE